MAKAQRINVESIPTKDMRHIDLTLTVEEAEALLCVTRYIGGNGRHSGRRHMDNIAQALRLVGVQAVGDVTGGIDFES